MPSTRWRSPRPAPRSDRNIRAGLKDPRIRHNLSDDFINDDGSLKWPPNHGASGEEAPELLLPGQILDKYGHKSGGYLAPAVTPFEARSLPYDKSVTLRQTYRVIKPFNVQRSRVAPWFGEPGGGTQFRMIDKDILDLEGEYLKYEGENYER